MKRETATKLSTWFSTIRNPNHVHITTFTSEGLDYLLFYPLDKEGKMTPSDTEDKVFLVTIETEEVK